MANEAASGRVVAGGGEAGTGSGTSSPKNRMKFLCSHGGKILPRPSDGHLKYVGGETRVIAVPRDISFSELMKKLRTEFEGDMVLKYQLMPEDLDLLVSVRNDEDLKHMLDEDNRHESDGTQKLRAFLFPSNPAVIENQTASMDPFAVEQRYIDAINGTVQRIANFRLPLINANRPSFSISACTSPKCTSPESTTMDMMPHESTLCHNSRLTMHKVRSSPSLYSLNTHHHPSNHGNHHYSQHHYQHHHPPTYQPPRPSDLQRLVPALPLGRQDFGRAPLGHGLNRHYSLRHHTGSGNANEYGFYDEHSPYVCRTPDRADSVPQSPKSKILRVEDEIV